jgi:hypothetical protein
MNGNPGIPPFRCLYSEHVDATECGFRSPGRSRGPGADRVGRKFRRAWIGGEGFFGLRTFPFPCSIFRKSTPICHD